MDDDLARWDPKGGYAGETWFVSFDTHGYPEAATGAIASRKLPGRPLGGFRYYGTTYEGDEGVKT